MELRRIIAYALLALLVAFAVGLVAWRNYNSRDKTAARSRRRESEAYRQRMAERERGEG
jgi:hypothetical protein